MMNCLKATDKTAVLEAKLAKCYQMIRCLEEALDEFAEVQVERMLQRGELQEAKSELRNQQNGGDKITMKVSATKGFYRPKANDFAEEHDEGTTTLLLVTMRLTAAPYGYSYLSLPTYNLIANNALLKASSEGDVDSIKKALKDGADLTCKDWIWRNPPLSMAAKYGHAEAADCLILAGAPLNLQVRTAQIKDHSCPESLKFTVLMQYTVESF